MKNKKSNKKYAADYKLDCIGLFCPVPVLKTRIELDKLDSGQILEVIADDPAAESDIQSLVNRLGHKIMKIEKKDDVIHFLIKKK